jgi:hypothetical protein
MAYASDKAPLELTALTTLASDDTIIVGDTSDTSEVAKSITKANLVTDLSSDFATAAQGTLADSAQQPPAEGAFVDGDKTKLDAQSGTNTGDQDLSGLMVKASNLSDLASAATARTNLGVDAAGTDNSTNVSLAGTPNYITIVGQVITRALIDLTSHVTGRLPLANVATVATSRIMGRSTAGTGDIEALTGTSARTVMGVGTSDSPQFTAVNVGHATDTTVARVSAGVISVEGVTIPTISSTSTLTNKRITKRTGTTTSSATPTINTDTTDVYTLTAQAVDITSFTTNLSGTPTTGQTLMISVTGTAARAITWGASFENGPVALPTTTVTTTRLDTMFMWNSVTSKWRCMATGSTV